MNALAELFVLALAQAETVGLGEYRDRLRALQEAVERKDLDAVHSGARSLKALRIRHDGMDLHTDGTVLGPLAEAKSPEAAREGLLRLRALRGELESFDGSPAPPPPDAALLERLREEEAERRISPGGTVGGPGLHAPEIPPSFLERLEVIAEYVARQLGRFLRWLIHFFLGGGGGSKSEAPSARYLVGALVATILGVLAIVAILALRRRQRGAVSVEAVSVAPAISEKDDDPLSRTATEWERFAAELMKGGRFREAIRAWYHAVLVTLFRAGVLHYRKDRTNWEYAYALPSTLAWRAGFMDATRTFEQEWYGRRETPVDTAEVYQHRAQELLSGVREGVPR